MFKVQNYITVNSKYTSSVNNELYEFLPGKHDFVYYPDRCVTGSRYGQLRIVEEMDIIDLRKRVKAATTTDVLMEFNFIQWHLSFPDIIMSKNTTATQEIY